MQFFRFARPLMALWICAAGLAQAQIQTATHNNVGRTPTDEEVRAWDIAIGTEGRNSRPGAEPRRKVQRSSRASAPHATGRTSKGASLLLASRGEKARSLHFTR